MKPDEKRLERAFTEAPSELRDAVELAFQRGAKAMKKRHKIMVSLSAAAVFAVLVLGIALAAGRLTAPRPDPVVTAQGGGTKPSAEPTQDIMNQITPEPTPTPEITPEPTPMPEITPTPTPEVTPEPTPTPEPEITLVYTQPNSNYYHSDPNCSGMEGAVAWTEASAISVGKQPCPVCIGGLDESMEETPPMVYYTAAGVYYHGNESCSGMQNAAAHTLSEAEAAGKARCPVCQPIEPDDKDLFVLAFGEAMYESFAPGFEYAYTEPNASDGVYKWYARSREDASVCRLMATFQAPVSRNGEVATDGGLRMKVWVTGDTDYASLLSEAPEPMRSMFGQLQATLADMPDEVLPDDGSPADMRIVVHFDEDRTTILDVSITAYGTKAALFEWQRTESGYELTSAAVDEESAQTREDAATLVKDETDENLSNDGDAAVEPMGDQQSASGLTEQRAYELLIEADELAGKSGEIWLYLSSEADAAWAFYATQHDRDEALRTGAAWFISEKKCVCLGRSDGVESWFFFTQQPQPNPVPPDGDEDFVSVGSYAACGREMFSSRIRKGKTTVAHLWMVGEDGLPIELDTGNGLTSVEACGGILTGKRDINDDDWVFLHAHDQLYQVMAQTVEIDEVRVLPGAAVILDELQGAGYTVTDCLYRDMDGNVHGAGAAAITVNLEQDGQPFHAYMTRKSWEDDFIVMRGWEDDINVYPGAGTVNPDAGLPTLASGTLETDEKVFG